MAERSYTEPTPVQAAVLAEAAAGRDLLVSAQTGSGKTVAYGLSIATNLLGDADRLEKGAKPLALIVAPTRELALQVQQEFAWLYQYTGARIVSCVGGMDPRREQRELSYGAHIVVGTPGRLCDHLRRGNLDVSELKAIVLDEADEMLDLGFREDLESILKTTPDSRRTLLFSATLPRGIVALAKQYQKDAFRIEVAGNEGGHADIEYRAIRVVAHEIEHAVVNVLRYFESPGAIVFCNTREAVRHLQASLLERGFSVVALSGELTQNERTHALQALRDGRARVCVATDVAARGIDLPHVGAVIHAELPNDPETLQHRSGRTGRAGRKGVSVLLVPPARRRRAELLLAQAGIDAAWGAAPQAEEIRKLDQQRMLQDEIFTAESTEDDLTLARALLAERSPEDIAAALARLYRSRLPSPEDILDPGQDRYRSRDDRRERRDVRNGNSPAVTEARKKKPGFRHSLAGGSVWFRLSVGRQKNAEARWLLPMICRRGSIDKHDIGAIRIYPTHTEFEISGQAAEQFSVNLNRPDKEENIRIEALPAGPQGEAPAEAPADQAASDGKTSGGKPYEGKKDRKPDHRPPHRPDHKPRQDGKPHHERRHKHHGEASGGNPPHKPASDQKRRHEHHAADARRPRRDHANPFAKPAFGKKPKKNKFRR
ncbi:DEAD/DEAH box helicase [Rhodoplanes sp. Z2-YC6860]|uniref:DEAD/DEAH box helicase n=1 Tax=Rhodoplanes sp. Z2-YC6860 TaxID=674703 RepID=UPI00082CF0C7|nr:DEAD/DEAH box helicase [Rhodoplanes sp. Z2-YC6860]